METSLLESIVCLHYYGSFFMEALVNTDVNGSIIYTLDVLVPGKNSKVKVYPMFTLFARQLIIGIEELLQVAIRGENFHTDSQPGAPSKPIVHHTDPK